MMHDVCTGVTSRLYSVPKHPRDVLNISLSLSLDLPMKEREARVGLVGVEWGKGEGGRAIRQSQVSKIYMKGEKRKEKERRREHHTKEEREL